MTTINKTSIRIPSQLPEFIRDDFNYETFVTFVQAYYEWLELKDVTNSSSDKVNAQNQGIVYGTQNLLNYSDVDSTIDEFLEYYIRDFLPYFPENMLADKQKVIKLARQLYQYKGTPGSYKLLFRLLYNSDAELQYTNDLVFKPSTAEWYIPQYLKLKTSDPIWLSPSVKNLRIFGITTKSFAVIENVVATTKSDKFNVYISQMERLFLSGETVRVVDSANQDVYFKDGEIVDKNSQNAQLLTGKIVGSISNIDINSKYRGLRYRIGDPVVVYGGLADPTTDIGAKAEIEEITKGSLQKLTLSYGGHGYRVDPNSDIIFVGGGGSGAIAHVQSLNTASEIANVTIYGTDIIALKQHLKIDALQYNFAANTSANANCTLANAFSVLSFSTSPIDSVILDNGGGGYTDAPYVKAISLFKDELPGETVWIANGIVYTSNTPGTIEITSNTHNLESVGILAPIKVSSNGSGYVANDKVVFSGGTGSGAFANVTSVDGNGGILSVEYVGNYLNSDIYPLGGIGYSNTSLPSLTISSTGGSNAQIYIPGVLGTGAILTPIPDRIGAITKIKVIDPGEDYISAPSISIKVQDLYITHVVNDIDYIKPTFKVIQKINGTVNYQAIIDSIELLTNEDTQYEQSYKLRVYNYIGSINPAETLYVESTLEPYPEFEMTNAYDGDTTDPYAIRNGIKLYGNGNARATARFLNGLIFGRGMYLNTIGHPSSYSVLQSEKYNEFTYVLSVEKPISEYRDILKRLLHPAGMKIIGRDILKNEKNFGTYTLNNQGIIRSLQQWINYPVGDPYASVEMETSGELIPFSIVISDPGSGYSPSTSVIISAPDLPEGVQATATANVDGGTLNSITITNLGSGYTRPFITINDPTTRSGNSNAVVTIASKLSTNVVHVLTTVDQNALDDLSNTDFIIINHKAGSFSSRIQSIDEANNNIILDDNMWLTFPNVAYAYSNTEINKIQISDFSISNTPNYDIINNKEYTDSNNHIKDIVFVGDYITIAGNTYVVRGVDYENHYLYLTNELALLSTDPDGTLITTDNLVSGYITTTTSTNEVVGIGTNFVEELTIGSLLYTSNNILIGTIDTITNANSLILTTNASNNATSNSYFTSNTEYSKNILIGEYVIGVGTKENPSVFTINRPIKTSDVTIKKIR